MKITPIGGQQRARNGLIFTVVDLDSGAVLSFQRKGKAEREQRKGKAAREWIVVGILDLVRQLAAELDAAPGRWRVRTISSPTSILGELRRPPGKRFVVPYERLLLGRIQRLDLLEVPPTTKKALRQLARQQRRRR